MSFLTSILRRPALLGFLALVVPAPSAQAGWLVGQGDRIWLQDPTRGGAWSYLHDVLAAHGVPTDFVAQWFDSNWGSHFELAAGSSADCDDGGAWITVGQLRDVIDAGKIPVLFWWWHNDQPCDAGLRAQAEDRLVNCLVPMLEALGRPGAEVWVVLQPEYNQFCTSCCEPWKDPSFADHLTAMAVPLHGVTGVQVRVGASPGDWGYDPSAYRIEDSLSGALPNLDFLNFHEIHRTDRYAEDPWTAPSPEQVNFALSYARFLRKTFGKPLYLGYWSVKGETGYGQAAQDRALLDFFQRRAQFEAEGVQVFGGFWYFDAPGFTGEGLRDSSGTAYQAWNTWKTEVDRIRADAGETYSIGFASPDYAEETSGIVPVTFLARGDAASHSFDLYYSLDNGPDVLIGTAVVSGNDVLSYAWDACGIAPSAHVRLKAVADNGTSAYSPKFSLHDPAAAGNATYRFDAGTEGWGPSEWGAGNVAGVSWSGARPFSGAGSLEVDAAFNDDWGYVSIPDANLSFSGAGRMTVLVYIPFELNPTLEMGAAMSKARFQIQDGTWNVTASPEFPLNAGWNRVVWDFGSLPQPFHHIDVGIYNHFPRRDAADRVYLDEIRIGGDLSYVPGACADTPTPTPASTKTPTATSTPTSTQTPIPTFTDSPTGTPTATPTDTATDAETDTPTATFTPTPTPTATATPTPTSTPTSTQTPTPTFTDSPTGTPTVTPTDSVTDTETDTPTPSFTPTATFTFTPTRTPTATFTPTETLPPGTDTPTPTLTPTASFTFTPTETFPATFTFTSTGTSTATPTDSPAGTPTAAFTDTSTATPTDTETATPTATATPTPPSTVPPTDTPMTTKTRTPTGTPSPAPTATETPTATPTPAPVFGSPSPTPSWTPVPAVEPITTPVSFPNPAPGMDPVQVQVDLGAPSGSLRVQVFTTAFRKILDLEFPGPHPAGRTQFILELRDASGAPFANGIYHLMVISDTGRAVGRLLVLR